MPHDRDRYFKCSGRQFNLDGKLNVDAKNTARSNDAYPSPPARLQCSYTSSVSTLQKTLTAIEKGSFNTKS
jgi:hypothetical protein